MDTGYLFKDFFAELEGLKHQPPSLIVTKGFSVYRPKDFDFQACPTLVKFCQNLTRCIRDGG